MAKLYCQKCGPMGSPIMRSSAGIDLDSLPPGPVPRSKCGVCGRQLYVGPSISTRSTVRYEERYRPFVVAAITGCILWSISGGFVHSYVISPDWEAMGRNGIANLLGWRPLIALIYTGFVFGLSVKVVSFIGASFRSEGVTFFSPFVVGAFIGLLQGEFVASSLWGFAADTVFRGENLRLLTGAICGCILSYPTMMIDIAIRRKGTPW